MSTSIKGLHLSRDRRFVGDEAMHARLWGHQRVQALICPDAQQPENAEQAILLGRAWASMWHKAAVKARANPQPLLAALQALDKIAMHVSNGGALSETTPLWQAMLAAAALHVDDLVEVVPVSALTSAQSQVTLRMGPLPLGLNAWADSCIGALWQMADNDERPQASGISTDRLAA